MFFVQCNLDNSRGRWIKNLILLPTKFIKNIQKKPTIYSVPIPIFKFLKYYSFLSVEFIHCSLKAYTWRHSLKAHLSYQNKLLRDDKVLKHFYTSGCLKIKQHDDVSLDILSSFSRLAPELRGKICFCFVGLRIKAQEEKAPSSQGSTSIKHQKSYKVYMTQISIRND